MLPGLQVPAGGVQADAVVSALPITGSASVQGGSVSTVAQAAPEPSTASLVRQWIGEIKLKWSALKTEYYGDKKAFLNELLNPSSTVSDGFKLITNRLQQTQNRASTQHNNNGVTRIYWTASEIDIELAHQTSNQAEKMLKLLSFMKRHVEDQKVYALDDLDDLCLLTANIEYGQPAPLQAPPAATLSTIPGSASGSVGDPQMYPTKDWRPLADGTLKAPATYKILKGWMRKTAQTIKEINDDEKANKYDGGALWFLEEASTEAKLDYAYERFDQILEYAQERNVRRTDRISGTVAKELHDYATGFYASLVSVTEKYGPDCKKLEDLFEKLVKFVGATKEL